MCVHCRYKRTKDVQGDEWCLMYELHAKRKYTLRQSAWFIHVISDVNYEQLPLGFKGLELIRQKYDVRVPTSFR
jgi:hypothetical protein